MISYHTVQKYGSYDINLVINRNKPKHEPGRDQLVREPGIIDLCIIVHTTECLYFGRILSNRKNFWILSEI